MGKPKPPWGASEEALRLAVAGATGFTRDPVYLPALGATEGERDLHLIWRHCMYYQILPEAMRGLSRDVLEYLSAHSGEAYFRTQDGNLEVAQLEKLRANADRARYELERRDRLRAATLTTLVAAAVGGGAGAIAAWWLTSL